MCICTVCFPLKILAQAGQFLEVLELYLDPYCFYMHDILIQAILEMLHYNPQREFALEELAELAANRCGLSSEGISHQAEVLQALLVLDQADLIFLESSADKALSSKEAGPVKELRISLKK